MSKRSFSKVDTLDTSFASVVSASVKHHKGPCELRLPVLEGSTRYFLTIRHNDDESTECMIDSTLLKRSDPGDICNSCGYWYHSDGVRMKVWGRHYIVCAEKCAASFRSARNHELILRTFRRLSRPIAINFINRCIEQVIQMLLQYFPRDLVAVCLRLL